MALLAPSYCWNDSNSNALLEWVQVQANLTHMRLDRSPFVPQTLDEYVDHKIEFAEMAAEEVMDKAETNTLEREIAIVSDRPYGVFPFGARPWDDGRRGALGHNTVFAPYWHPDYENEHPQAPWPTLEEFREEGDERHTSNFGRFLPIPRVPGNPTVNWKQKAFVVPYDFDRVRPVPKKYNIRLPWDREDNEPELNEQDVPVDDPDQPGREVEARARLSTAARQASIGRGTTYLLAQPTAVYRNRNRFQSLDWETELEQEAEFHRDGMTQAGLGLDTVAGRMMAFAEAADTGREHARIGHATNGDNGNGEMNMSEQTMAVVDYVLNEDNHRGHARSNSYVRLNPAAHAFIPDLAADLADLTIRNNVAAPVQPKTPENAPCASRAPVTPTPSRAHRANGLTNSAHRLSTINHDTAIGHDIHQRHPLPGTHNGPFEPIQTGPGWFIPTRVNLAPRVVPSAQIDAERIVRHHPRCRHAATAAAAATTSRNAGGEDQDDRELTDEAILARIIANSVAAMASR